MADREDGGRPAGAEPDEFGTQPLPLVPQEGLASDAQSVRAVAKRVPSALPAIGRDDPSDLPASARATADRRRREREAADGPAAAAEPEPPRPAVSVPRQREPEPATTAPDVELVPIGTRSRETPVASEQPPAATPNPSGPAEPEEPSRPGRHAASHETPYASGGQATPPPPAPTFMGQPPESPERVGEIEIVDAEIVEDRPRPFPAADVQTDEWTTVPPPGLSGPAGPVGQPPRPRGPVPEQPRPGGRHAGPPAPHPGPPPRPALPAAGPGVLAADSWSDTSPLPPVEDEYQGRRRRGLRRMGPRPSRAGWLVVLGVVLSLSAAVAVPFLISSVGPDEQAGGDPTRTSASAPTVYVTTWGPSGLIVVPAPATTAPPPTSLAGPSSAGQPPATTGAGTTPAPTTTAGNPPPVFPMTVQAESASLSGCAQVRTVSGASVVDRLGEGTDWGCSSGWGTVTFNNVSLPAGRFTVTIYYVFDQYAGSDSSRYARLRIDPDGAGSTIDFGHTYPRTTTCCQSWTTASFTASAGTFDISFTNPGVSGPDRAPALDRIVIQKI